MLGLQMQHPSQSHPSWQQPAPKRSHTRAIHAFVRIAIATVLLLLIAGLTWLLFPPFFSPQTHLVLVRNSATDSIDLPIVRFAEQDFSDLVSIDTWNISDWASLLQSKDSASRLGKRLQEQSLRSSDRLVMCIAAQGTTLNGEAVLLCDDFDHDEPERGSLSIRELLRQIASSSAGEKLIVLYGGSIEYSPRLGVISDSFLQLVTDAVHRTGDRSLWVYCSHSPKQSVHVETAVQRSVFGMFFAGAVAGAADANTDGHLTIDELTTFTSANVQKWVEVSSEKSQTQTPFLIWGGGETIQQNATLLAVSETNAKQSWTPSKLFENRTADRNRGSLETLVLPDADVAPGTSRRIDVTLVSADSANPSAEPAPPNENAQGAKSHSPKSPKSASAVGPNQISQLSKAWALVHPHSRHDTGYTKAITRRPHLLRELQQELISLEQQLFFGSRLQSETAAARLAKLVRASEAPTHDDNKNALLDSLFSPVATNESVLPSVTTDRLTLLSIIEQSGKQDHTVDLPGLERAIRWQDRKLLEAWMKANWTTDCDRYQELRWIKWLYDHPVFDWKTVQVSSLACLIGERAAALDYLHNGWGRQLVEQADALRNFAARQLRSNSTACSEPNAKILMNSALELYQKAIDRNHLVSQALEARDQAIYRLPFYFQAVGTSSLSKTMAETLEELVESADHLAKITREPDSALDQDLEAAMAKVLRDLDEVDSKLGDQAANRLAQSPPSKSSAMKAWQLLRTPFLSSTVRFKLYRLIEQVAKEQFRVFELADLESSLTMNHEATPSLELVLRRTSLLTRYASIALTLHRGPDQSGFASVIGNMQDQHDALTEFIRSDGEENAVQQRQSLIDEFEQSLTLFYDSLVTELSTEPIDGREITDQEIALRFLAPSDSWRFSELNVQTLSMPDRLRSTMCWQLRRQWQSDTIQGSAVNDADVRRIADLLASEDIAIPQITGVEEIDLQYQPTQQFSFEITNPTDQTLSLVLSADFDPERLSVDVSRIDPSDDTRAAITWQSSSTPLGTPQTEPIVLEARDTVRLEAKLSREALATSTMPVHFDWYATSKSGGLIDMTTLLLSQHIAAKLPVAELVIDDGSHRTVSDGPELGVLPFPNRLQDLKFGLIAGDAAPKEIELSCYSISQPLDGDNWQSEWLKFAGEKLFTSTYKLDTRGTPIYAAPPVPKEAPKAPPEKTPDSSVSITNGLVVVLKDTSSGQQTLRRISFAVQRPRRYLGLNVAFDSGRNRIVVDVAASDPQELPAVGPVNISCRLANVSEQLRGKLSGLVTKSHPADRMFIELPSVNRETVRLFVDVDGFPRAFVFDVQCNLDGSVTERTDLLEMQLQSLSQRNVLPATDHLQVTAKLNMPVGRFENANDFVEVGLDLNKDGVPDPESRVRSYSDRQVDVALMKASADGRLSIKANVNDFVFTLPASRLENLSINVAGRVRVGPTLHTYAPLPLYIDGEAPIVGPADPASPNTLPIAGKEFHLDVWGFDRGSGVQRIEAVLDQDGSGAFPKAGPTIAAIRKSLRRWDLAIKLPADVTPQTLLVRGIDEVGNVGKPFPVSINVTAENQSTATPPAQIAVRGLVQFHGKPVPDAEITVVTGTDANPMAKSSAGKPTKTRSMPNGTYQLAGLNPGKYTLMVRAVIRNRVHLVEQSIELKPSPSTVITDVTLP